MLQSLHVKNLALIEETEIHFGEGLNILTGETGAGKSLLIGSVNLALGGKFDKDMLRKGTDTALVELVFSCDEKILAKLQEMDLEGSLEEDVIISRKMQVGKSTCKINGETVTIKQVKELAEVLLDVHGQHEHQSLLHKKKHLEILDSFCGEEFKGPSEDVAEAYAECNRLQKQMESETRDEQELNRERSLAEFEYQEITDAGLKVGEDDELEQEYRLMTNSKKIAESLTECHLYTGNSQGAGDGISRALKALKSVSGYDEKLGEMEQQLTEIDNLLSDFNKDVADYLEDCDFAEEDFRRVEDRLNTINHLKGKYGRTIEEVLEYARGQEETLQKLSDYDGYIARLKEEYQNAKKRLDIACEELSKIRKKNAVVLTDKLKQSLIHLNFLTVEFEVSIKPAVTVTEKGMDDVEFMISTNPGESMRPLAQVASGGELSRIMLAIKTVLAGRDDIDTLIFDEIDTGISGKTAWKVAEQLHQVACAHQVICITHLSQIAAMADQHFLIEKNASDTNTITDIRKINEEGALEELARLLGSDELSEAALLNAKELKKQAQDYKNSEK